MLKKRKRSTAVTGWSYICIILVLLLLAPQTGVTINGGEPLHPRMAGTYVSVAEHPRVFVTSVDLRDLAARINTKGSYSQRRFAQLVERTVRDLDENRSWNSAYSGCNIETYLYAFSYEVMSPEQASKIRSDFRIDVPAEPPAGAAVAASRLALYAALVKSGATTPGNAPDPDRAADLAKKILSTWAERGFRDAQGEFLRLPSQFCLADGRVDAVSMTQVGLQISRGIIYSVHAQDLLSYLGAIDVKEKLNLDKFHGAMYELIRNAVNYSFITHRAAHRECDQYSNHVANQLAGLLATARLIDDKRRFDSALLGDNTVTTVMLPWVEYFNKAIYGNNDTPISCRLGSARYQRPSSFETNVVAAGEIVDRHRNANPLQGIGYPMFTLERLYSSAEILRVAHLEPYAYRGTHGESMALATRYYACYARSAGFGKIVTLENSSACQNVQQYVGKSVNGVDRNILIGAYRYPSDVVITELEPQARVSAENGPLSLDPILFGKWRD